MNELQRDKLLEMISDYGRKKMTLGYCIAKHDEINVDIEKRESFALLQEIIDFTRELSNGLYEEQ